VSTNQMTAKEFLSQAFLIDQRIKAKMIQAQTMRDLTTKATGILTGMPKAGTPDTHSMETFITNALDLESQISEDLNTLVNAKRDVTNLIRRVSKVELQSILELRYLCFLSWDSIAAALNYSPRHVLRLHNRGLEAAEQIRTS